MLFFASSEIHEEYRRRHPKAGSGPLVRANDIFFAVHAAVISLFTLSQVYCWGYARSRRQYPSPWAWGLVFGSTLGMATLCLLAKSESKVVQWIDVCYALSFIKLICSFVKYVPQVICWRTRLTLGCAELQKKIDEWLVYT